MRRWLRLDSTISWREAIRRLAGAGGPPWKTAASVALGLGVGMLPISPFQTPVVLGLAFLLGLNRVGAFLGTLVWQPFTAPAILAAEYAIGVWILGPPAAGGSFWARWVWPVGAGAPVVALGAGAIGGLIVYGVLRLRSRQRGGPSVLEGEGR